MSGSGRRVASTRSLAAYFHSRSFSLTSSTGPPTSSCPTPPPPTDGRPAAMNMLIGRHVTALSTSRGAIVAELSFLYYSVAARGSRAQRQAPRRGRVRSTTDDDQPIREDAMPCGHVVVWPRRSRGRLRTSPSRGHCGDQNRDSRYKLPFLVCRFY